MIIPNIPSVLDITPTEDLIARENGRSRIQENNLIALEKSRDEVKTLMNKSSMMPNVLGNNIDITA